MKIIAISEKQLNAPDGYIDIKEDHLLISIKDPKEIVTIPNSRYQKELLQIEFKDTKYLKNDSCFSLDIAKQILDFVDAHCIEASMIVVQCKDGLSRSVAIASALSKIINHKDDEIFSNGIPNIIVYTALLDYYFYEVIENPRKWISIYYLRDKSMQILLDAFNYRKWQEKE